MFQHTFVICAYGESPYLQACIQSCVNQTSVNAQESKLFYIRVHPIR